MRSGRAALIAAVCGWILVLSGCSDDGGAVVLPTGSADATTEPTESLSSTDPPSSEPTPTTTLVLPDEHVPEVDEFVRQFFATYNATQDSGDFTAFDAMYLPQCTGCVEMRDELESWLADGGSVEGADWVVLQQNSSAVGDTYGASVIAYRTAGFLTDSTGSEVETIDQSPIKLINFSLRSMPSMAIDSLGSSDAE